MKKRIGIPLIVYFAITFILSTIASEEQTFREELDTRPSSTGLSYQKYRDALTKLLYPGGTWDVKLKYILLPLGTAALVFIIILFIRQIRRNLISEAHEDTAGTSPERVGTEKAALAQAQTAEAASDFRTALRFLYLSAILHLQERGILPYDKSLTNREYLHQAQADSNLQATLGPAVTVFDEVWYGHKPCDAETVANYRSLLQKVYAKH